MDVGWVGFALDDGEAGDVAGGFAGGHGDHSVFWLEESTHDVENGCFADGFCGFDAC